MVEHAAVRTVHTSTVGRSPPELGPQCPASPHIESLCHCGDIGVVYVVVCDVVHTDSKEQVGAPSHLVFCSCWIFSFMVSSNWTSQGVMSAGSSITASLIGWNLNSRFFPAQGLARQQCDVIKMSESEETGFPQCKLFFCGNPLYGCGY